MARKILLATLFLFSSLHNSFLMAQQDAKNNLPSIRKNANGSYSFIVDGKPFIVLGAQLWNSSNWPYILNQTWPLLQEMHCNTLEAPVYWQALEPNPGQFHFDEVDSLINGAKANNLK